MQGRGLWVVGFQRSNLLADLRCKTKVTCLSSGLWPYAFTEEAIDRSKMSADAFISGLEAAPSLAYNVFNVSLNNGTATAQMPAVFITPDNTNALPTVILTTGTDFTKEVSRRARGKVEDTSLLQPDFIAHIAHHVGTH